MEKTEAGLKGLMFPSNNTKWHIIDTRNTIGPTITLRFPIPWKSAL